MHAWHRQRARPDRSNRRAPALCHDSAYRSRIVDESNVVRGTGGTTIPWMRIWTRGRQVDRPGCGSRARSAGRGLWRARAGPSRRTPRRRWPAVTDRGWKGEPEADRTRRSVMTS